MIRNRNLCWLSVTSPWSTAILWSTAISWSAAALLAAPAPQLDPDEPIDLDLKSAALVETLQSFAQISGSRLDLDPTIAGAVTATFKSTPWRQILGSICNDHALNCEILGGEPPVLRVRPTDAARGAAAQPGYAEGIDLSLKKANLRETLQIFSVIASRQVIVDDDVTGTVTIELKNTPWTVVLEEICNLSGCQVEWGEKILRIHPLAAESRDTRRADVILRDTPLAEAFDTLAALPIFGPLGQPDVALAKGLSASLDLELIDVSWLDALNAICQQADCRWELKYGAPSKISVQPVVSKPDPRIQLPAEAMSFGEATEVLASALKLEIDLEPGIDPGVTVRFEATEASWQKAAKSACQQAGCVWSIHDGRLIFRPRFKALAHRPAAGAKDQRVAVRFFTPTTSVAMEGTPRFNWTAPIHTFDPGGDDRWMARLSWIPFGPEHHLLVPMVLHCGQDRNTVELLEPVRLPLEEPHSREWRGAILELSPAGAEDSTNSETLGGDDCAPDSTAKIRVTLRRAGSDGRGSSELDLPTRVGTYLVVTPPGGERRPAPIAAVLALGADGRGRQRLALVRPGLDRPRLDERVAQIDQRMLAASSELQELLETQDGRKFELILKLVPQ